MAVQALPGGAHRGRIELRQLHYFVTLAEELHFGRAAAREHIAPSALTAHVQRLERAVGVQLVERTSRSVKLTRAGARFLVEARQILDHVERAAALAQGAAPTLRVGLLDEGYDAIRPVLRAVQARHPDMAIHQVQAGVPEQRRLLADGRLDIGVGLLPGAAAGITAEVFRRDPLGVLVPAGHPYATQPSVPVTALRGETLLLADEEQAPEANAFVTEVLRSAGCFPQVFPGSVQTLRAAVDLVAQGRCVLCTPASTAGWPPDVVWRQLDGAVPHYPWSLLWRGADSSRQALAVVTTARLLAAEQNWRAELAGGAA
ncbi:LysR family transcriptional regulator [Actinoplanes sp. N902-109]|uniref:LysR family transcriptional regulator n=1 Tax=Actinoplanes sp. (strain N902-109) TaxID=649831 RepID=UPI00032960FB|nr:LysR substrate-binding domain-containing protein [Actinoplanes sp. N902-109]AGL19370.1 LysR family transcriptional regulator [Actinoplanes sp. N902-109]